MNYYPQYNYGIAQPQITTKIVDGIEMCRMQEVPFGSFGVFVKGDMTETYLKQWCPDGTTKIITYKAAIDDTPKISLDSIQSAIDDLSCKIDKLSKPSKKEVAAHE